MGVFERKAYRCISATGGGGSGVRDAGCFPDYEML